MARMVLPSAYHYSEVEVTFASTESIGIEQDDDLAAATVFVGAKAESEAIAAVYNLRIFVMDFLTVLAGTALAAPLALTLNLESMMANETIRDRRTQLLEDIEDGKTLQSAVRTRSVGRGDALAAGLIVPSETSGNTIPIFIERISQLGEVALADLEAQRQMRPMLLHHLGSVVDGFEAADFNRNSAIGIFQLENPNRRAGQGESYEEYPFASSREGGPGAYVDIVPEALQWSQGGQFTAFLRTNGITPGSMQAYIVLVMP